MAVYTKLSLEEINQALGIYNIGQVQSFAPIEKGIENSNYLVVINGQKYIFTIFENRVENADLPFFMRLTQHLHNKGIACPKMFDLIDIKGKKAALITFLNGSDVENIQPFHIAKLGNILAKMHLAVADFKENRKNSFALSKWVELFKKVGERADELAPNLTQYIADELHFLAANWPFALPSGVVHTDLFPDNIFFENGEVTGVIDFYFSCSDYFAYDAAICINAWNIHNNEPLKQLFLNEYQAIRPFSEAELSAMPILLRGAAMRFLSTRLYDWFNTPADALVKKKDPLEYYNKLKYLAGN